MPRPVHTALALALVALAAACQKPAAQPASPGAVSAVEQTQAEERALALFPVGGDAPVDRVLRARQEAARRLPKKAEPWILVGQAFVEKARVSSDPGYYLHADAAARLALRLEPGSIPAQNLRALVLLNDHRFEEAKALASAMLARDPWDPMAWGTLSDALLELGDVEGAAEAAQRMIDLKPNLPSYARASFLHWLHGDVDRATEAIRLAFDAGKGQRDPEPSAWVLTEAAMLFWHQGDFEGAEAGFDLALRTLPGYAPALVGKARAAMALERLEEAERLLEQAFDKQALVETAWLLADARRALGDEQGAQEAERAAVQIGRRSDARALALFLASRGRDLDLALSLITEERRHRGGPFTDDAYAWVLYRLGRLEEARTAIESATRHGTRDARLLYHRGAILAALGDPAAPSFLEEALRTNPAFDREGAAHARALLSAGRQAKAAADVLSPAQRRN